MRIILILISLMLCMRAPAQLLKNLKDKVIGQAKDKARTGINNTVSDQIKNFKAEFDSTDFDYALLLSDNSGLFNGKKKGEFGNKFLTLRSISSSLKDADLTDAENAKLNLEMGQAAYATERFVFAEKRFIAAKSFFEKAGMTSDFGYLKTLANQGLLYTTMGRFSQAEKVTADALNLRVEKLGQTNMAIAASLNNYAVLHYNVGQYNEAEKEFDAAMSVIQTNQQQSSLPAAIILNNEAMLFQSIGRYDAAVKALKAAIDIASKQEKDKSRNHQLFLSNLALLYQEMGKYDDAENIYQDLEKKFEKSKPEYANMLDNFATLYLVMGKQDKVEDMLKKSAAVYRSNFGENSPAYAKVISDLGNFYRYKGRYAEAEPMLQQALTVREDAMGKDHPLFAQSEEDLAILYWKIKAFDKAYPLYHDVMEKSLEFINRYFPPMSESEKSKYLDILSPRFQRFYNFAAEAASMNENILSDLFEYRVATKGLLLNSIKKITNTILASRNQQLIGDYSAWIDQKEELTRLYAFSKADLKEQNINIDSLEEAANTLEKKLSENSRDFARFFFTSKITVADLKQKLKDEDALIEIIRVRNYDQVFTDSSRYFALVVTKQNAKPNLVVLNNGFDMENSFFKTYRVSMKNRINDEKSFSHYWGPVEAELKNKKRIFISLDGVYNQLNLYSLKNPNSGWLINQYDLILLSNAKDVLTNTNTKISSGSKDATLLGYPDYGPGQIPELPGTKVEVDGINKLLKSSGYRVEELIQKDASEANLKSAKSPTILHIATHGYFFRDVDKPSWPIGVHQDNAKDNVLLRSGLLLTGASNADNESPNMENVSNGIMTSYEAMNLDLQGTRLVVLSACETGLGEVKAGEGVYGLQRAFLAAGAEALIMSLWKVDDAATQQLMTNFYSNWIKSGDKQKAFKQAQLQLMTKFKEPYYWGAFVMMGS